ncbi:MAG: NAD-dependent epimerase/dehydratase family protein [Verrucomicrobiae bacterium]|nr:NAD-dependent epimerase/dehydratase family protein [Verrucomicrobiae bacterium]
MIARTKPTNGPRILVTGAAGFIGSHTTDQLLGLGCRVMGVDDLSTGHLMNLRSATANSNFRFVRADITGPNVIEELCAGFRPDAIVHLAGLVSVVRAQEEPNLNYRLNLHATHLVAEAARLHGVRRAVFASSAAIYGDHPDLPLTESALPQPISLYGMAKRASEEVLMGYGASFGLETVCLRYFNVYGPRQDPKSPYSGVISIFAERFAAGNPVTIFGDGSQTRDFVAVEDIARANALAATRPGLSPMVCNVCTGRPRRLLTVLDVFRSLHPDAPAPQFAPARPGEIQHSLGNPERAADRLGFVANTELESGLRAFAQSLGTANSPQALATA